MENKLSVVLLTVAVTLVLVNCDVSPAQRGWIIMDIERYPVFEERMFGLDFFKLNKS